MEHRQTGEKSQHVGLGRHLSVRTEKVSGCVQGVTDAHRKRGIPSSHLKNGMAIHWLMTVRLAGVALVCLSALSFSIVPRGEQLLFSLFAAGSFSFQFLP